MPVASGARPQRFELEEKFWAVAVDGTSLLIHFGKIGSDGHRQIKTLPSAETAGKLAAKLIADKTKKGYQPA